MFVYKTKGVCATEIHIDVENSIIKNVNFVRGCAGNLLALSTLVNGMNIDEAIDKLKGIECGTKGTSCPDQLSKALEEYKKLV